MIETERATIAWISMDLFTKLMARRITDFQNWNRYFKHQQFKVSFDIKVVESAESGRHRLIATPFVLMFGKKVKVFTYGNIDLSTEEGVAKLNEIKNTECFSPVFIISVQESVSLSNSILPKCGLYLLPSDYSYDQI